MEKELGYTAITSKQVQFLTNAINKSPKTSNDVCEKFCIDKIEDLRFNRMTEALNFVEYDWKSRLPNRNSVNPRF